MNRSKQIGALSIAFGVASIIGSWAFDPAVITIPLGLVCAGMAIKSGNKPLAIIGIVLNLIAVAIIYLLWRAFSNWTF